MKKVNPKKAAPKKEINEDAAKSFEQLSKAFKADIQKAHEANDVNTLVAKANQFISDTGGLFQ